MAGKDKKTLILIDAHAILHRAFHALPNFTSPKGEPTGALYGFTSMLLKILKEFRPDYIAACYDLPKPTFRHLFYEKYKAKRPKMAEELSGQIERSRKILAAFNIPVYEAEGFEADDVLATAVEQLSPKTKKQAGKIKIVIVSGDLDTLQLVKEGVEVYAMKKGIQEAVLYDREAVIKRFGFVPELLPDYKGLIGDPSDNIVGVKGIGEKTGKLLIQRFGTIENLYKALKNDKKVFDRIGVKPRVVKLLEENEEEAYFSKTLAETRRDVPFVFSVEKAEWKSDFDKANAEDFFRELGFRSLLNRIPSAGVESVEPVFKKGNEDGRLIERLKLAFWLLDSRRINPALDEIMFFTKTGSLAEAMSVLEKQLENDGLLKLYSEIELPLIDILSRMGQSGILLDTDYLKNLSVDYRGRLKKAEETIWAMSGEKFNISSPKQLAEVLFEKMKIGTAGLRRTGKGSLSTRFSELEKIKDKHPVIEEIFFHRELSKLVSTYVDALPSLADKNNRLHTSFNQTGTTTGRLSSSEPNLQNIPVRTDFGRAVRGAFISPPGWLLASFDYSQIELRTAAFLSGDKKLKEAFLRGDDIHNRVAAEVFNVSPDKVTPEMRRRAKVINFGIIYGMGVNSLKRNLGCSKEEAEMFYNEYFTDFSGMSGYIEKIKEETAKNGFTVTFFGRRRYLPEINSPIEHIRKEAERMAINAPIQGTAADIIKRAMVNINDFLRRENLSEKIRMVLQVHDELIFEVKSDTMKEVAVSIKSVMENLELFDVPLVVDVSAGRSWFEMEKIKLL